MSKKFHICLTMLATLMLLMALSVAIINCDGEALTKNTIEKIIGPDGGTLLGPIGSMIIIPPGALDENVTISAVEVVTDEVPELENGGELISVGVLIEPENLNLNLPINIYMPYAEGDLSKNQLQNNVSMYVKLQNSEEWEKLPGTIEFDQHLSMSETETLGVFAVFFVSDVADGDNIADGDTDTEIEAEAAMDCSCEKFAGNWCASVADCTEYEKVVITASDEISCGYDVALLKNGEDSGLSFQLVDCSEDISVVLTLAEQGECTFYASDTSDMELNLECESCNQKFSKATCN